MIEILESFGRLKRELNLAVLHELKPLGLGYKQAGMLRYLAKHKFCSQADLARYTITDPAATGKMVAELVKQGLLSQKEHASDKRRWVISLTPKGTALARRLTGHVEKLARQLAAPLDHKEQRALVALLDKISDSISNKGN